MLNENELLHDDSYWHAKLSAQIILSQRNINAFSKKVQTNIPIIKTQCKPKK